MLAPTFPEPAGDIAAQLAALRDPVHPRDAVFIAGWQSPPLAGVLQIVRTEGTLLTTDADKARAFEAGPVDEDLMARLLGYPISKAAMVGRDGDAFVVQARDALGRVLWECVAVPEHAARVRAVALDHVAADGAVVDVPLAQAVERRARLIAGV